jgi:lipopolysaccharide heptosyltransferase I
MRLLVVKMSSLGDLFHALPAVHSLAIGLEADIDWVVHKDYVDLVRCFTDVDRVIAFHRRGFLAHWRPFLRELRAEEYDVIVDLQGLLKSAMVCALARGKRRVGPSFHREGARLAYSEIAGTRNKNRHAVEENLDVVRHLGLPVLEPAFRVDFPSQQVVEKKPRVAILPVSRWPTKNWPVACFAEVAQRLQSAVDACVYLFGAAEDAPACKTIEGSLEGRTVSLAGQGSLADMGGMLKEMDLLIANDSGPVHMAVAVGTPALVVFGPTDPVRTGPYGKGHRVARTSLPCQPCFSRACRREGIPCLEGVTPEQVAEMALDVLAGREGSPSP